MFADRRIAAMLPASDIDRAKAFYRDTLGIEPVEDLPAGGARYEVGGTNLVVYPSQFAGTNEATALGWDVEDLDAAVAGLKAKGVEFSEFEMEGMTMENSIVTAPDGMRSAWFYDSERNIIALMEWPA